MYAINIPSLDDRECVERQDSCKKKYEKAKGTSKKKKCSAAREYRECLVESASTIQCLESVTFPHDLDQEEADSCPDPKPRQSCQSLEISCKNQWDLVSGPLLPGQLRCIHARKWVECLEKIILDGGCFGGYTVNMEAQVERILSCYIATETPLDRCGNEWHRCWLTSDVSRKYLDDTEDMCDNVLEAKACLATLRKDDVCPSDKQDPGELTHAEQLWCKERHDRERNERCDRKKKECEEEYEKKVKKEDDSDKLCRAAEEWQACYLDVVGKESCIDDALPRDIATRLIKFCYDPDPADACRKSADDCFTQFLKDRSSEACARAQTWRQCLEALSCLPSDEYPQELATAEATSCYS
ncbi:hypothetical protein PoB_000099400 [Plakobranchus ocellatus]|uniref:Uncharacterized protein n=1 Tax=Plakobranchus ocellatus TaxID=259542 RepID=A0AAV3XU99_9GAST|nr:hypothetical protein PoB_000099400 [Plakobranchus ocellatus]